MSEKDMNSKENQEAVKALLSKLDEKDLEQAVGGLTRKQKACLIAMGILVPVGVGFMLTPSIKSAVGSLIGNGKPKKVDLSQYYEENGTTLKPDYVIIDNKLYHRGKTHLEHSPMRFIRNSIWGNKLVPDNDAQELATIPQDKK